MADLKVSDLLVPNYKQWHTENIYLLFDNVSAQHICRTPLFVSVQQDRPTWKLKKNGIYLVRNAYRNIMGRSNIVQEHDIAGRWNQVWRCKLPPSIKNFVWRVARGCLPSKVRLQTRGVNCTTQCPFCDGQEDSLHALFLCPKSIQCWQKLELWNDISTTIFNPRNISFIHSKLYRGYITPNIHSLALSCGVYGKTEIIRSGMIPPKAVKLFVIEPHPF